MAQILLGCAGVFEPFSPLPHLCLKSGEFSQMSRIQEKSQLKALRRGSSDVQTLKFQKVYSLIHFDGFPQVKFGSLYLFPLGSFISKNAVIIF